MYYESAAYIAQKELYIAVPDADEKVEIFFSKNEKQYEKCHFSSSF